VYASVGTREAAAAADVERLTSLLREVLEATGYTRRHPANAREEEVRRLVRRMGLSAEDVPVWLGVMRQVLRKTSEVSSPVSAKKPLKNG
jgi:tRNA/rRNA methyltransferase